MGDKDQRIVFSVRAENRGRLEALQTAVGSHSASQVVRDLIERAPMTTSVQEGSQTKARAMAFRLTSAQAAKLARLREVTDAKSTSEVVRSLIERAEARVVLVVDPQQPAEMAK